MLDGIARGHIGQSLRTLWTAPVRHAPSSPPRALGKPYPTTR